MERTAVKSRDLAIVGYDEQSRTLEIAFKSGGVYRYREVPERVYQSLLEAPSLGTYFQIHIRDQYPATKVH